ncbi:MAG TPA: hypothetical protein VLL94_04570 [Nitrospiraceae bacterium]|nr:hypothetical protein [Nitrospiraceae bacterium]
MRLHILVIRSAPLRIALVLAMVVLSVFGLRLNTEADESLPSSTPDFPSIIRAHSDQLAKIESDKGAGNLFVATIGPALQMGDVARTLGSAPLSAKLANELLVPDLTAAVQRLMGSLAAWHMASSVRQAVTDQRLSAVTEQVLGSPHKAWLDRQEKALWHYSLNQLTDLATSSEWTKGNQEEPASSLSVTVLDRAVRLEMDAMQASYQEWDRIRNWKDRVRKLRGQARLCGTWQWIIHNHQQRHQEQKLSVLFPPAGTSQPTLQGLMETIVLGDNVYLRWELNGRVQEDSLQFSNEGQRLEGTFLNSEGGWGSISGKRTAGCMP